MSHAKAHPHAIVRATHAHGYGHLNVSFENLFPGLYSPPQFVIRSQTGGSDTTRSMYGWKHGIESNHDPLNSLQLKLASKLMRRIDVARLKNAAEGRNVSNYPEYVLEVLHAARVRHVHFVEAVNGGWTGEGTGLPMIDCFKDSEAALLRLHEMTEKLYGLN